MQLSLTPQGEFLAPSPAHPQKCVNIARTQLAPLYSNVFVSLFPQSPLYDKLLRGRVMSCQNQCSILSPRLTWSLGGFSYGLYSPSWNTFFAPGMSHSPGFYSPTGKSLSISSAAFSISFPTTIHWHTSGFSLSVPFSIYAHALVDSI